MISTGLNCIFVHIPKTGGQSVEHFFLGLQGLTWKNRGELLLRPNDDPALGPERLAHLTAGEYVSCGHVSEDDFARYYRFSFVRNPYARLVSEFRYSKAKSAPSFKRFVIEGLPHDRRTDAYRHLMPQYDFLHDAHGALLVDYVGRFERLQSDFEVVCRRLGLEVAILPHVNASTTLTGVLHRTFRLLFGRTPPTSRHYSSYYDAETREVVSHRYALDLSTFGYDFEETPG